MAPLRVRADKRYDLHEVIVTQFFAFEEYGTDATCNGTEYGEDQDSVHHTQAFGQSKLAEEFSRHGSTPYAYASVQSSEPAGPAKIQFNPLVTMPQSMGRCFQGGNNMQLPEGSVREYYSWACGTGKEMMLLGFDDLDSCRDAFYCSIKNPKAVMKSAPAEMQEDPIASCEAKLVPAIVPFLDDMVGSATPWLSVVPYTPPCIQIPVDYPKGRKEAWRVYLGCAQSDEGVSACNPKTPDCAFKQIEAVKFDERGTGIWNLRYSHRIAVATSCVMAFVLCFISVGLALFSFVKAKRKERKNPTIV